MSSLSTLFQNATLSPLDGRYRGQLELLLPYFSEEALMRARVEVELLYFLALGAEKGIADLPPMNQKQRAEVLAILQNFSAKDYERIKTLEKTTRHDVKAVEYFIKEKIDALPGLKAHREFVHFCLTSEDVNNLSYGLLLQTALKEVLVPELKDLHRAVASLGKRWMKVRLLSLTHGQPATPTLMGKEMLVFADRLERQIAQLKMFKMQGKFGGAVGNYSAHRAAYPKVQWERFGHAFVRSLGLSPLKNTTQINPHDDLAELSHLFSRINVIGVDFARDMWQYVSRGVLKQKVVATEVGSSAMPHKVNPIDFENAEGNLGLSTAIFSHFAEKLPISRLQRDLSDSTVQRNLGVAFGHHFLALYSLEKGLSKVEIDRFTTKRELMAHPEVLAEAIQVILRRKGTKGAYERLKALTRGHSTTVEDLTALMLEEQFTNAEIAMVLGLLE